MLRPPSTSPERIGDTGPEEAQHLLFPQRRRSARLRLAAYCIAMPTPPAKSLVPRRSPYPAVRSGWSYGMPWPVALSRTITNVIPPDNTVEAAPPVEKQPVTTPWFDPLADRTACNTVGLVVIWKLSRMLSIAALCITTSCRIVPNKDTRTPWGFPGRTCDTNTNSSTLTTQNSGDSCTRFRMRQSAVHPSYRSLRLQSRKSSGGPLDTRPEVVFQQMKELVGGVFDREEPAALL